jgi:hypothetical protein
MFLSVPLPSGFLTTIFISIDKPVKTLAHEGDKVFYPTGNEYLFL